VPQPNLLWLLDQDVTADVGMMLRRRGQDCISAGKVGLATASDEEISVFADNRHAICVTQDREMITQRRRRTFGRHVHLDCPPWDAAKILEENLSGVIELVESRDAIVVRASRNSVKAYPTRWA
jgi:predicted nuclease of predicted toxin-antitoxin system